MTVVLPDRPVETMKTASAAARKIGTQIGTAAEKGQQPRAFVGPEDAQPLQPLPLQVPNVVLVLVLS
jgi:hypothetical protein